MHGEHVASASAAGRALANRGRQPGLPPESTTLVAADQVAEQRSLLARNGPDLLCPDEGIDDNLVLGDAADTAAFQDVTDDVRARVGQIALSDEPPEPIHVRARR